LGGEIALEELGDLTRLPSWRPGLRTKRGGEVSPLELRLAKVAVWCVCVGRGMDFDCMLGGERKCVCVCVCVCG